MIVIVITIIVLAILAATVIITITNSGLINSSKDSVATHEWGQVRDLANVAWAEALADSTITTEEEYVRYITTYLKGAGYTDDDLSKYNITADANGVNVALKENESDEEENDSENETVETISFKIVTPSQEIVLYAEKNMSWDDWMNSSTYNTIGVYLNAEVEYDFCYYSISNFEGDHYCYGMGKYDDGCSPTLSRWTYLDEGYAWTSVPDDGAILYYTSMP